MKPSTFLTMLEQICERPCLFVLKPDVTLVASFLDGYAMSREEDPQVSQWRNFQWWVQGKLLINDPSWHWTRILLDALGSHERSIAEIPGLFRELLEKNPQDVALWMEEQLMNHRGSALYSPGTEEKDYPLVALGRPKPQ